MAAKKKPAKKAPAAAKSTLGQPFTPYQPQTNPPPGTYDPVLDSQLAAGARGLEDFTTDTATATERANSDFATSQGDLQRQRGEGIADIMRTRAREGENYGTQIQGLDRNYSRLANTQAQQQRGAGTEGGAFAQALAKRTANRAIDQAPIDTAHARFGQDSAQQETRFGQGIDRAQGAGALSYQRGEQDRGFALARAGREQGFLGTDTAAAQWAQAKAAGYDAPTPAPGEHQSALGSYKLVRLADGRLVNQTAGGAVIDRKTGKRIDVRTASGKLRPGF